MIVEDFMHRGILLLKRPHQALHDCINDDDGEDYDYDDSDGTRKNRVDFV